jgi:hypothetical protein
MATQKQIEANRKNSLKSTGPITDSGKAVIAKNAIKHGLCTSDAVIGTENLDDFNLHADLIIEELVPVGPMETILTQRIVTLSWRLKRAERIQNHTIDTLNPDYDPNRDSWWRNHHKTAVDPERPDLNLILGRIAVDDFSDHRVLDRLLMYERRIERSFHKTMIQLQRLQYQRKPKNDQDKKQNLRKQSQS